jgi:hypothetical protein
MSIVYTINVINKSEDNQDFFFFQAPATYTGGVQVYSNSLHYSALQPYSQSGVILTFQMNAKYCAGAQTQMTPPSVGHVSGGSTACQPINLAPASGPGTQVATNLSVDPLGLTPAYDLDSVQPGAFRIITPTYKPNTDGNFNIGTAIQNAAGGPATISNFIVAQPNQFVDCQPLLTLYVQIGNYQAGEVINFSSASINSAICDTSSGHRTFNITYLANGKWTVEPRN